MRTTEISLVISHSACGVTANTGPVHGIRTGSVRPLDCFGPILVSFWSSSPRTPRSLLPGVFLLSSILLQRAPFFSLAFLSRALSCRYPLVVYSTSRSRSRAFYSQTLPDRVQDIASPSSSSWAPRRYRSARLVLRANPVAPSKFGAPGGVSIKQAV